MTEKHAGGRPRKYELDPRNARTHPARNMDAVGKSLKDLGAGRSIVVDADGVVIGGNAVYTKAQELGIPVREIETNGNELVVVRRVDLKTDDPRRKALALADNQISTLGEWDEVVLEDLKGELLGEIDFETMGFDEPAGEDDSDAAADMVDKAAELLEKWEVERGQIWEIPGKAGVHRVMCGDSTDGGDVALLMDGVEVGILIADPPYGMNLDTDYSKMAVGKRKMGSRSVNYEKVIGDDVPFDVRSIALPLPDSQFWFGADYYSSSLGDTEHSGAWLVWDKRLDDSADKMFGSCFELIWSSSKRKRDVLRHKWAGFFTNGEDRDFLHPTTKPVSLIARLISMEEGNVADPFLGSGTTVVAAEQEGRVCYGMELEPKYVAVVLERMASHGLEPVKVDG